MEIIKNFFKSKRINYFIGLTCAVLMIFVALFYLITYSGEEAYFNHIVWIFALVGGIAFIGLSILDVTVPFAPVVLAISGLATFTSHIRYCYMYFTNIFFNGVTLRAILDMNVACTLTILIPLTTLVVGITMMYLKQNKVKEGN